MPHDTLPSPAEIANFHRALHAWYTLYGRHELPWRKTKDPYRIYISEIMLQQTQVKTVLERYYVPFIDTFPTLSAVASADLQTVIKQWEGLGYYTRARNIHAAAKQCGGVLPETVDGLLALPGIGRNTAHAIACFAFGQAVPVMEANVRRVLCRVFALEKAEDKLLWEKAALLLDQDGPFDYNQAMMDIGALVCSVREPACVLCPLGHLCQGKLSPASYPAPKTVKPTPVRQRVIVVLHDAEGYYYLQKRKTRFLHGLYGFPEYPAGTGSVSWHDNHYPLAPAAMIGEVTQVYSHFTLQANVYQLMVPSVNGNPHDLYPATLTELQDLPLSRVDHKIARMLRGA